MRGTWHAAQSRNRAIVSRSEGEVRRGDIPCDLVDRLDRVRPEPRGVLANDVLVRRPVDAERLHAAAVVDCDVTVLPRNLGELLLCDLTRAPSDLRHLLLPDLELALDEISRHRS